MTHIDVTPSWQDILPTWLLMFEQAIEGNCSNPDLIKANAKAELRRRAEAADNWNEAAPFMQAISKFTAGELTNMAFIESILEAERNLGQEG